MAFNDPFSFASPSELEPIYWNEDTDGLLSWTFPDFIAMDDLSVVDPIPTMNPPKLIEMALVPPPSSSALLTDYSSFHWSNPPHQYLPFMENHWEQPLPFIRPDTSGAPGYHAAAASVGTHHQYQHQQISADESSELDYALALSPDVELPAAPPAQMTTHPFHHYYAPPPTVYSPPMMYGQQQPQSSPYKAKRSHRVIEDDDDTDISALESEPIDFGDEEDPTGGFKLPASKSPIMEAMVVCALNGWGIDIITNNRPTSATPAEVIFRVTDFNRYYKISRAICSKQRPTDDLGSRIKSLRRWFVNFPKKKDRCENSFNLIVKPAIAKKVNEIIERNSKSLGLTKRRRRQ